MNTTSIKIVLEFYILLIFFKNRFRIISTYMHGVHSIMIALIIKVKQKSIFEVGGF